MECLIDSYSVTEGLEMSIERIYEKEYVKGMCKNVQLYKDDIEKEFGKGVYKELYDFYCNLGFTKY